jgi:hypothetical protein
MTPFARGGNVPIEDRIDQLSRLALVILLFVTLGWIGHVRPRSATPDAAAKNGAPLILATKSGLREGLVKRPERRAKAI